MLRDIQAQRDTAVRLPTGSVVVPLDPEQWKNLLTSAPVQPDGLYRKLDEQVSCLTLSQQVNIDTLCTGIQS